MTTPLVSVQWLQQNLSDPDLIILDASPATNVSGLTSTIEGIQIKGARFFDLKKKFSDLAAAMTNTLPAPDDFERACRVLGINQNSKIVVYDNLGIYTSPRVWWMFKTMGHEVIAVLDGGLPEWHKLGYPTESKSARHFPKGNFKANPDYNLKRDIADVVHNIDTKEAIVVDARSEGRFCGTAPEPREGLSSGHMPHAVNLPFPNVLDNGKMKSKDKLKTIFDQLNIDERPLIFSCGSGLTACVIMLAAELALDNPAAVYDGSWTEWAQLQTDLIEKSIP